MKIKNYLQFEIWNFFIYSRSTKEEWKIHRSFNKDSSQTFRKIYRNPLLVANILQLSVIDSKYTNKLYDI